MRHEREVALHTARAASSALLALRECGHRLDPSEVAQLGDCISHRIICDLIREAFPADAILSEEGDTLEELERPERLWVVDPLDGTKEYAHAGREDWAVQIALVVGETPVLGVVALPAQGWILESDGLEALAPRRPGPLRIAVSRTRRPELADLLADELCADLLPAGSVGAKTALVIAGDADLYLHAEGQFEWDSAGPVAVARAAGLVATRVDGSPLRYNQSDPYLPDILITRPEIADRVAHSLHCIAATRVG